MQLTARKTLAVTLAAATLAGGVGTPAALAGDTPSTPSSQSTASPGQDADKTAASITVDANGETKTLTDQGDGAYNITLPGDSMPADQQVTVHANWTDDANLPQSGQATLNATSTDGAIKAEASKTILGVVDYTGDKSFTMSGDDVAKLDWPNVKSITVTYNQATWHKGDAITANGASFTPRTGKDGSIIFHADVKTSDKPDKITLTGVNPTAGGESDIEWGDPTDTGGAIVTTGTARNTITTPGGTQSWEVTVTDTFAKADRTKLDEAINAQPAIVTAADKADNDGGQAAQAKIWYTGDTLDTLKDRLAALTDAKNAAKQALDAANGLADTATQTQVDQAADILAQANTTLENAANAVNEATAGLKEASFLVMSGDERIGVMNGRGEIKLVNNYLHHGVPSDTLTLKTWDRVDHTLPDLKLAADGETTVTPGDQFGTVNLSGTVSAQATQVDGLPIGTVSFNWVDTQGAPLNPDGATFTKTGDDYTGAPTGSLALTGDNTIVLADDTGKATNTPWTGFKVDAGDAQTILPEFGESKTVDGFVTRTTTASGTRPITWNGFDGETGTLNVNWQLSATAARSTDTHADARLLQVKADGTTGTLDIGTPDANGDYTITLGQDASTDTFSLLLDVGPETVVDEQPSQSLGHDASRVITWKANGVAHTLTILFDRAPVVADSPAKLTGIYVDYTGKGEHGDLIDGWDPNRLDYTISVGKDAPSPIITPEWDDGSVSVTAADVRLTPDGSTQTWRVTAKSGDQTRSYSVTLVRDRDWQTAAEKFQPAAAKEITSSTAAGEHDATIESVGWVDQQGKYTTGQNNGFDIPEGGTFAYTVKAGQRAGVSKTRLTGMTWRYTIRSIAPDGVTVATRTVDVTYITAATHAAALTGIRVNGHDVNGFNPAATSYTVTVDNADQWVVTPVYDRESGMTVDVAKNGTQADITVTSADTRVKTVYTVTVSQTNPTMALAQTGVTGVAALAASILAGMAGMLAVLRRRLRRS